MKNKSNSPLRVLMCCSDLSFKGGMVSVVKGYLDSGAWPEGVRIEFVPTHREGGKLGLVTYFLKAYRRIGAMARRGEIDVAHLHTAERGSFFRKALLAKILRRHGVPVVMHHHGAEFEQFYAGCPAPVRRWISRVLADVDVNIVLSRRLVPMITSKAPEARVEVVYNAVQAPAENPYSLDSKGVLLLGRLGERKGAYDLLEAIRLIDKDIPSDVRFYLCGDGEIDEVKARAESLGIQHRIAHVGWIDGAEKERILSQTMINVLPSYNEGLPMTILETMGRGIPNISTPVASIPEVIHDGQTGLLVNPGDTQALAAALRQLIGDAALRRSISVASHALIRRDFDLTATVPRLVALYRSLK